MGQIEAKGRPVQDPKKQGGEVKSNAGDSEKERVSLQKRTQKALGLLRAAGIPKDLDWVSSDSVIGYDEMGTPDNTAQVHPFHFTTSMATLAEEAGVKIILGARVTSINPSGPSSSPIIESVTYTTSTSDSTTLLCSHAVLAAGPWTQRLLPSAPISGLRAHSVTIKPTRPVSGYALFTSISLPANFSPRTNESKRGRQTVTPEIYARPGQEIYACGEGDTLVSLPSTTADVVTDDARCQDIVDYVGSISDELRNGEVTVRQACYLPVVDGSGGPYIGEVKEMKGLVLASGHSCWGIMNGPATGKLVSEIIMDGRAKSAKLGVLDPKISL